VVVAVVAMMMMQVPLVEVIRVAAVRNHRVVAALGLLTMQMARVL
jgi:hypothetical protein